MKKPTTEISARRGSRGRKREDASFPAPPSHAGLPNDYATILAEIKQRIQTARLRTVMAAYPEAQIVKQLVSELPWEFSANIKRAFEELEI